MGERIIVLIGLLVVLLGVIMIYDARTITKRWFGFGDQNEGAMGLKILGFILSIIGGLIAFINF